MNGILEIKTVSLMIAYENVLKSPDLYILEQILQNHYEKFEPYLKLSEVNTLSPELLFLYILGRRKKNLLEWLSKTDFNYKKNYDNLHSRFLDMYERSIPLRMYDTAKTFIKSYCIEKVYIWNPVYDKRQHYDLTGNSMLDTNKSEYVTGAIQNVIDRTGINLLYHWDADECMKLINSGKNDHVFFCIANYPFNLGEDGLLKEELWKHDNVATFPIYDMKAENLFFG